ncbi:putative bifunctional diguanylate cyclase/phosphodiesterase [Pseudohongiella spirulinae]|uniref:Uncharacterized protein n=1 Tax=Pseudohongiella spirulinae TaxID=1249552 RepID=A0A0S2KAR1_9GAMM|nr:EAL domain-containing protein [Pseudohongiella spirulinae]ALO45415.1 hypothetical protein PS2015_738 [Pseudohongiella spirulinae]
MSISSIKRSALTIALIYLISGSLWIIFSDRLPLPEVQGNPVSLVAFQTAKGLFYVMATSVMLYWLSIHALKRQRSIQEKAWQTEHQLIAERQQLAYFDTLTGLPNRLQLIEALQHAVHSPDHTDHPLALLYIDLDDFKSVNDSLGHNAGDELLRAVSSRLTSVRRPGDLLARLGGDEFAIMARKINNAHDVHIICHQILQALAAPFTIHNGRQIFVEACIGASLYPADARSEEALMRNADTAMYRAKHSGRNRYVMYEASMSKQVRQQLDMETSLRQAVALEALELHFQPKVDCASGKYLGAEALLRWPQPDGRYIAPAEFIPLAERTGLIIPIGDLVLEASCKMLRQCLDSGLQPCSIAVNISLKQFRGRSAALEQSISTALSRWHVPPQLLSLEITESALMENPAEAAASLNNIRATGITIAIDDFGTGFSNMMQLSQLPIDILKIDTSFTHSLGDNTPGNQVIRSVIELAHRLKLKTVAEGVETEQQWQILKDMGCDHLQGYLFSRPLKDEDFIQWLQEHGAQD